MSKEHLKKIRWTGSRKIRKSWRCYNNQNSRNIKNGVKVSIDKNKSLIVTIKKVDLAKEAADQRVDIFAPGNALDAKITELEPQMKKLS